MTSFNFYTKDGAKDVHIESCQFTFIKGDEIDYLGELFIVNSVEYKVAEESITQFIWCVSK